MTGQMKLLDLPVDQHDLETPLTLAADQLERVVGGTAPRVGPIGPINGLIRVPQ